MATGEEGYECSCELFDDFELGSTLLSSAASSDISFLAALPDLAA